MNQTKINNILLIFWAILLVINLMNLLYTPLKFNFLLTGFVLGMFLQMLMMNPLLNIKDKYIKFLDKTIRHLFEDVEKLQKKKSNSIKRTKK